MKKYVLLFLALSSLTFANVVVTNGRNVNTDGHLTVNGENSASIDITVSAIVTDTGPAIEIVDEDGNPVTSVSFIHELAAGTDVTTQQQKELTANLRIKATAGNTATIQSSNLVRTELNLTDSLKSTLSTTVPQDGAISANGTPFTVTSTLSGTVPLVEGTYSDGGTSLTITYAKQTNPQD